jgi:hypothetical protein
MSRGSRITTAAALLALAAPAAAQAAPAKLPLVQRTLDAVSATARADCALRGAGGATDRTTYTAPVGGFLDVRTRGGRGDWDLAVRDARTGALLGASQGFGANEVVQTWVRGGQRLSVQACRRQGASRSLGLDLQLVKAKLPKADLKPMLLEIEYASYADLERLEQLGLDVTHSHFGGHADVIAAGSDQLAAVKKLGLPFEIEIADLEAYYREAREADRAYAQRLAGTSPLPSGRTTYRTYEDIQAELKKLADENPGVVKPMKLPQPSRQGRDVNGIEISSGVDASDDGKPTFLLTGIHHAREWPSADAAMEFALMVVNGAKEGDARMQRLLDTLRIVIVPLINPDGFIASRGAPVSPGDITNNGTVQTAEAVAPPGGVGAYRRKNCAGAVNDPSIPCELQYGVDPNRNYGNGWGGPGAGSDPNTQSYRGTGPWSEPETQNVHEFSQQRELTGFVTMHTIGAMILRPPALSGAGKAPDEMELKRLGDAMGEATGWRSMYSYQLYDTSGTAEDWNYAAAGTLGYTIEIGPQGGGFHMPYQVGVVDQWTGASTGKGGLREALLIAAEASADAASHSVLTGNAPAGTTLRLRKEFVTKTAPVCTYAQGYINSTGVPPAARPINCLQPGMVQPAMSIPDFLDYTTDVGPDGAFRWHVTQSTRPFVAGRFEPDEDDEESGKRVDTGEREAYTLTCERDGQVLGTTQVIVDRGETKAITPDCG